MIKITTIIQSLYIYNFKHQSGCMQNPDQQKIRVVIRKRPLNKKQMNKNEQDVVEVHNGMQIKVREHKLKVDLTKYIQEHMFTFDSAFDETVNNQGLYEECIKPIISSAFLGAKVTCFAYGQTGSGKTYTMNGDIENGCPGIYYLGAEDLFSLRDQSYHHLSISVSFFQIYCGKLFDLLNNRQILQARQDGKQNVNIVGLTVKPIESREQFMDAITYGSSVRITSQNGTNSDSSRSHAILQISLMNGKKVHGKISFIDLAGCERGADTIDQNKQTKLDGAEINKSLLALKECIRALDQGKNHTPFRGSKLTMVLKDSFTGFCRTVMIGNVSPGSGSCENTLNTLRYADRVKQLKKGSSTSEFSRQEQLARELMLPRTMKNRQIIIRNESDSDQQIIINPAKQKIGKMPQKKQTANVRNAVSTAPIKKMKYLQKSIQQEETGMNKKNMGNSTVSAAIKARKGIMNNNPSHMNNENNRSVNTVDQRNNNLRGNRNKSMVGKLDLHGINHNIKNKNKDGNVSDRKSFQQNNSAVNLLGNHDINSHLKTQQQKVMSFHKANPYIAIQNIAMKNVDNNFKKVKTQQSDENHILQAHQDKYLSGIILKLKGWKPNIYQSQKMSYLFEELAKNIIEQESQVSSLHRDLLLSQQKNLSQSLQLHNILHRAAKSDSQMLDYTSQMSKLLSTRMSMYGKLREKIQKYQYYLAQYQECESKLTNALEKLKDKKVTDNITRGYASNDEYLEQDVPLWIE